MNQFYKNSDDLTLEILIDKPFMSCDLFELDQIKEDLFSALKLVNKRIKDIESELDPER